MTRVIEVSHWGNIAVEETVDLKHTGAVLKGPFSRYDYQRQPDSGISSVKSFKVCIGGCLSYYCIDHALASVVLQHCTNDYGGECRKLPIFAGNNDQRGKNMG